MEKPTMKPYNLARLMDARKAYNLCKTEENRLALRKEAEIVDKMIHEVEGRATVRTITAYDIADWLEYYEDRLPISKAKKNGIVVWVNPCGQAFKHAYKYIPMSTYFDAVYKNGSWRLIGIYRSSCTTCKGMATLPDETRKAILDSLSKIEGL